MAFPLHIVDVLAGSTLALSDRLTVGLLEGQAMLAGSGAGAAVSTTVTGKFPATYMVFIDPHQDGVAYTTTHTATSFVVVMNPRLAANTLAATAFDALVVG